MSGIVTHIEEINLSSTKDGKISICKIDKPYGEESESVVSIGVSLQENNDEPEWKIHIPKDNIDSVIAALEKVKKTL